jgi:hypothetical protein
MMQVLIDYLTEWQTKFINSFFLRSIFYAYSLFFEHPSSLFHSFGWATLSWHIDADIMVATNIK